MSRRRRARHAPLAAILATAVLLPFAGAAVGQTTRGAVPAPFRLAHATAGPSYGPSYGFTAPRISGLTARPRRFRVGAGLTLRFSVSAEAQVQVAVRRGTGRRGGVVGRLRFSARRGANVVEIAGFLRPGRYRISLQPRLRGLAGRSVSVTVQAVAPRRARR